MLAPSELHGDLPILPDWRRLREDLDAAIFVADSCVYLHLFRLPADPRAALLRNLQAIRPRLWVPSQVQDEVADNSTTISAAILQEAERTADTFGARIDEALVVARRHARRFSTRDTTLEKLLRASTERKQEIERHLRSYGRSDRTLSSALDQEHPEVTAHITNLMTDRIGQSPSAATRERWEHESSLRVATKQPPTYADRRKKEPARHSDYIIWRQIVTYALAQEQRRPIVFVTRDHKDGGWVESRNGVMRTHKLLAQEFTAAVHTPFYVMGTSDLGSYVQGMAEAEVWEYERHVSERETLRELGPVKSFFP